LLHAWRNLHLPLAEAKVIAAVSGGADSTALLLALDELIKTQELRIELIAAHLDHGLRRQSKADARWVIKLARDLGYQIVNQRVDVGQRARITRDNLEQAARRARYEFLAKTAATFKAQLILTAHTMDDQAETIVLRLLRGSGAEGLAGIEPVRSLLSQTASPRRRLQSASGWGKSSQLLLARPLLNWARRSETEDYCRLRKVDYRSDLMNDDEQFARVRVRKQLLPLMASFNGRIVEALARTAELLRDDLSVLNQQASLLLLAAALGDNAETLPALSVAVLAEAPVAVRRRALRQWILQGRGDLRRHELQHVLAIEKLLLGEKGGRSAELPGGDKVVRRQQRLELSVKKSRNTGGKRARDD